MHEIVCVCVCVCVCERERERERERGQDKLRGGERVTESTNEAVSQLCSNFLPSPILHLGETLSY